MNRILCLSLLLFVIELCDSKTKYRSSPSECGFVYLTVSSLETTKWLKDPNEDDKLELNWDLTQCAGVADSEIPNKIALFNVNPETATVQPLETVNVADRPWNYHVTQTSLGPLELPAEWTRKIRQKNKSKLVTSGAQCLPFWIASYKDEKLLSTNCLKYHPTWMSDIKSYIADIPLSRLLIPGTHNAGAYAYGSSALRNVFQRYVLCQDRDLWTQLVSGVRYLDFRIAYYDTLQSLFLPKDDGSKTLWLNHNMIKITPLLPLFKDIRRFLDSTSDEIVILDVHQLPVGFYQSDEILLWRHHILLDVFKQEFADHILSFEEVMLKSRAIVGPTVGEILKTGKRLIIGYPDSSVTSQNRWLWPNVRHMWGNTNDAYMLKDYLDSVMENPYRPTQPGSTPLWSAMAQTTPSTLDVILNTEGSLRKNADAINRNLTYWLQHEWWNKANIVASDFYLGNNLVEVMVHLNSFKGRLMKSAVGKFFFPSDL